MFKNQITEKDYHRDLFLQRHSQQPQTQPASPPPLGDGGRDGGKGHRKTIYLAGKVTGLPYKQVVASFAAAQRHWELAGYNVINPMLLCAEGTEWQPAMRICIAALALEADYIHPLPNWHQSRGAAFEMYMANIFGIPVI